MCCDSTTTPSSGWVSRSVSGGLDALVGAGRRHPDVGEHDVGLVLVDGGEQPGQVVDGRDHVDVVLVLEHAQDALAHDQHVLGDHHPQRHRRANPIRRPPLGSSKVHFVARALNSSSRSMIAKARSGTNSKTRLARRKSALSSGVIGPYFAR